MNEINARFVRTLSMLGSCGAYGLGLVDAGESDKAVVALTADLRNYSGLERFAAKYPDRFFNVGIAEQNLVNVAAGMAAEGFNTFASTYATFASMRCADQVRTSMGYMRLPVRLVGLTAGYSVGILGPTHMSIEDIAVMRSIPNLTVISPADGLASYKATLAAADVDGPVYLRLTGTMGSPVVYGQDFEFCIGRAGALLEGTDVLVIATGSMVYSALQAAEVLVTRGVSCAVLDMHTIKPLDAEAILSRIEGKGLIATVEEHSVIGGLGSAVLELLAEIPHPPIKVIGAPDVYPHAGEYNTLVGNARLDASSIAKTIEDALACGETGRCQRGIRV